MESLKGGDELCLLPLFILLEKIRGCQVAPF